jgi:hypothetical protein
MLLDIVDQLQRRLNGPPSAVVQQSPPASQAEPFPAAQAVLPSKRAAPQHKTCNVDPYSIQLWFQRLVASASVDAQFLTSRFYQHGRARRESFTRIHESNSLISTQAGVATDRSNWSQP